MTNTKIFVILITPNSEQGKGGMGDEMPFVILYFLANARDHLSYKAYDGIIIGEML